MIPHNLPALGIKEEKAVLRVLKSRWLAQGHEVQAFEDEFCEYMNLSQGHAVAVANGTSALYLAAWALGGKNKKIAIPVYSCSALRNAVQLLGAKEVLIDCSSNSPNIDPLQIEGNTIDIAIMAHMYGIPIEIESDSNFQIIEDCAQSIGTKINGKPLGLQGTLGIFSFYATKPITSGGQGGMIISKDLNLIEKIKDYREFDCRKDRHARFNFKMTDIQGAIGRAQLESLPQFIIKRAKIYQRYLQTGVSMWNEFFLNHLKSPQVVSSNYFRSLVKCKDPNKIIGTLERAGIKSIIPIESWELLGDPRLYPNAFHLTQNMISLPIYPSLTQKQIDKIIVSLKKIFDNYPTN